jgi:hypothetical protein
MCFIEGYKSQNDVNLSNFEGLVVEDLPNSEEGAANQCTLGETHLAGEADKFGYPGGGLFGFDLNFDVKAVTETFGVALENGTLLVEFAGDFDTFVVNVKFAFGRNLRHM